MHSSDSIPSLDDLLVLADAFMQDQPITNALYGQIVDRALEVVRKVLLPIWEEAMREVVMRAGRPMNLQLEAGHTHGWAVACFGIGAERAWGTLPYPLDLRCLLGVCTVFASHLAEYLVELEVRGTVTEFDVQTHVFHAAHMLFDFGSHIAAYGESCIDELERANDEFRCKLEAFAVGEEGDDGAGVRVRPKVP